MTLIIAAANADCAILASDRRLTLPGGKVLNEEACKLTVFACKDAKVMIAYTGSAHAGNCSTEDWIIETLSTASNGNPSIYEVLDIVRNIANSQYRQFSSTLQAEFKLELMVVGFLFSENVAYPKVWRISNFNESANFTISYTSNDVSIVELAGTAGGVTKSEISDIRNLLLQDKLAHGIEMKLVDVIKKASDSTKSGGTVGKQINSCTLSRALNSPFVATYHSEIVQNVMYAVNSVFAVSEGREGGFVTKGGSLTATGQECQPVSFPKLNPSQRCACGSGLKYKHCHSRISYPFLPVFQEETLPIGRSLDSGNKFTVYSYGAYGVRSLPSIGARGKP